MIEPTHAGVSLPAVLRRHPEWLERQLRTHGALLFRGFAVTTAEDFAHVMDSVSRERLGYVYRSTPRSAVGDRVFTATAYPAGLDIPLHQENAYQRRWPRKLALCCLTPAQAGGNSPLADMVKVTARMPEALLSRLEHLQVRYVRHYHEGTDLPWQEVFQTDHVDEVARFCASEGIDHEWLDDGTLRTTQVCQGVIHHPETGERLFFNQAHLFHASSLGAEAAQALQLVFGEGRLPRHATFGNGEPFSEDDLQTIRQAFAAEAVEFSWKTGDIVLVDNMRVAHARRPYTGYRRVLAAMSDMYDPSAPLVRAA